MKKQTNVTARTDRIHRPIAFLLIIGVEIKYFPMGQEEAAQS